MTLIIRKPKAEDHVTLEHIFFVTRVASFIPKLGENFELNDYDKSVNNEELWVAEVNDTVVGFTSMLLNEDFIHNLFVHPYWHRLGVGSALLKKAESRLRYPMELRVRLENLKACKFYQKNGWRIVNADNAIIDQCYCYRKYAA